MRVTRDNLDDDGLRIPVVLAKSTVDLGRLQCVSPLSGWIDEDDHRGRGMSTRVCRSGGLAKPLAEIVDSVVTCEWPSESHGERNRTP